MIQVLLVLTDRWYRTLLWMSKAELGLHSNEIRLWVWPPTETFSLSSMITDFGRWLFQSPSLFAPFVSTTNIVDTNGAKRNRKRQTVLSNDCQRPSFGCRSSSKNVVSSKPFLDFFLSEDKIGRSFTIHFMTTCNWFLAIYYYVICNVTVKFQPYWHLTGFILWEIVTECYSSLRMVNLIRFWALSVRMTPSWFNDNLNGQYVKLGLLLLAYCPFQQAWTSVDLFRRNQSIMNINTTHLVTTWRLDDPMRHLTFP